MTTILIRNKTIGSTWINIDVTDAQHQQAVKEFKAGYKNIQIGDNNIFNRFDVIGIFKR